MGLPIGLLIIFLWAVNLAFGLSWEVDWGHPVTYLLILTQTHLYTGLFITAHDAMHRTLSPSRYWNDAVGGLCALLFAYNWYPSLLGKHHRHHHFVATGQDPDYHSGSFLMWYLVFIKNYISWPQLLAMAVTFNLLLLVFSEINISLYWMIPAILSTLQLFLFGTYLPHRGEHDNPHFARSQSRNHLLAFVSCYFFGYHYEHHDKPWVPWWKLWQER